MKTLRFFLALSISATPWSIASTDTVQNSSFPAAVQSSSVTVSSPVMGTKPIHALHVTSWKAGSKKYREHVQELFKTSVINCLVIDIKEFQGEVYIPGVKMAEENGAYVAAMPDIADWIKDLKRQGIYTVARIVTFKDNIMPRKHKSLAVHNPQGELWFDRTHTTWLDPYNEEAWRYDLLIAAQAAKLGFDEIQFDYIRFPTDGNLSQMRFSKPFHRDTAPKALISFLTQAHQLLAPLGVKISIDVFGLTTSDTSGMGIGQLLKPMSEHVDYVCPMIYPSHYAKMEYGIPNPNDEPYKTIHLALHYARELLGPEASAKLRPYLQDFSLKGRGIRYGAKEVRAQMQAAADLGFDSWTLWNARCSYTLAAIQTPIVAVSSSTSTAPSLATSSVDAKSALK